MNEQSHDPYVRLAIAAIRAYTQDRERIVPPASIPEEMHGRAGVFVSLKKEGLLRGCIGTFLPTEMDIAHEIIANAIKAATQDPRFTAVTPDELSLIEVSVDVLGEPEPCTPADLDPKRYGVIVRRGWRRGLLLPDLPGVDTVEEQLRIARLKAGIMGTEPIEIDRFTVERHDATGHDMERHS